MLIILYMSSKIIDALIKYYPGNTGDGIVNQQLQDIVTKITQCQTIDLGGHFYSCPEQHSFALLYNSCKQRGCPVCNELKKLQWIEKKLEILLPVEHYHLVYKLPSELSLLWLMNKKEIAKILFDSVKTVYEKLHKRDGIMRGITNVLHTSGKNLSYHPHIHSLVTVEGLTDDNELKKKHLVKNELVKEYRELVKRKLLDNLMQDKLKVPTTKEEYIRLIEKSAEREWDIFQSEIYANGEGVIKYCAKHLKGMAVEEKEIKQLTDEYTEIVHDYNGKIENVKLPTKEFVTRYLNHIPPKGLVMVRNLGLYSTRRKKKQWH